MAAERPSLGKVIILGVYTVLATAFAEPNVAFPFNSQVPTVARVGQPYSFQFSESTFSPDNSCFTYSLSNQPAWLSLDSATRTLSGNPSQADVGASEFTITAANNDGAAHMACTMVVSKNPPPKVEGNISQQLAATVNLSSRQPPVISILSSSLFQFHFKQSSFIDIVTRQLYYYATLADHTPLPSWLLFDSQNLTFSGIAPPPLSASSQSWEVELIASDVAGFAGTAASFTIVVSAQQLVFVPDQQFVTVAAGKTVNFNGLQDTLFRDGTKLVPKDLKSAKASVPSWLHFDPSTLAISGTAPTDVQSFNATVTVEDQFGEHASVLLSFTTSSSSVFAGAIGTLTAHAGQEFNYYLPDSLFRISDFELQLTLPSTATWLHFDAASRVLSGKVPFQTQQSSFECRITAKFGSPPQTQTQTFSINILPPGSRSTTGSLATNSSPPNPNESAAGNGSHSHLNSGVVAAVILGCLLAAAILAACLVLVHRRKKRQSDEEQTSPPRRVISRPILQPDPDTIMVTTELQRDVEKTPDDGFQGHRLREPDDAPQIALDLPANSPNKRFKWSKRFSRISPTPSSLGVGEHAVRADGNIPEWGVESTALHRPHESFSIPTEIARSRSSKQNTQLSPTRRAFERFRKRRRSPVQSIGLGIDTGDATVLPRHGSRGGRSDKRAASSAGFSVGREESSVASLSTRGTSVLSTRPSDFPRPPTQSSFGGSRPRPRISISNANPRKSIRLVERSDSIADDRSMREKRQSFIRNRASTTYASPLFANGARVTSAAVQNGRNSVKRPSPAAHRRSKRGHSQTTTYSQSSSLEPPPRDPRRLSARVRSAFPPNYPRAVTQSTIGADDESITNVETSSFYTTDSPISDKDFTAEMALPRHQRSWVLPGEASPTPPPAPPTSRQASGEKRSKMSYRTTKPRRKWKEPIRDHSSSPLSTAVAVPLADRSSLSASARMSQTRRSRLGQPMSLVSNDSPSRSKPERPRLVQTNSKRPVSIEKVERLRSLKAEAEDSRPGSEMFEALEGAGLMPPSAMEGKDATQKSNMSGPAFL